MRLDDPRLKLTPKRIEAMHALGLTDTESLLSYYPLRYEVLNAKNPEEWEEGERITFFGHLAGAVRSFRYGRNQLVSHFQVQLEDGYADVTIFNRPWAANMQDGTPITVTGIYKGHHKVTAMSYNNKPLEEQEAVTPVYSTKAEIQQRTIRACIHKVLETEIPDVTPIRFRRAYRLMTRKEAMIKIHEPKKIEDVQLAARTLKYQEFLQFFTTAELMKNENGGGAYKAPRPVDEQRVLQLLKSLPYELTPDQAKAIRDILKDIESNHVMHRLLQGDVGCGKTLVAAVSLYACMTAGYQGILLAPTELLVRQHLASINELFGSQFHIEALYSGMDIHAQEEVRKEAAEGTIDLLIGTHSLLSDTVQFKKPGLLVIDEQQRFGVEQRRAIWKKAEGVDCLLMSATPIPRTLASALFGDMDVSTIETMPPGRKPVLTYVLKENSFRSVLGDVKALLAAGRQLYVICASIDPNDEFPVRSVSVVAKNLTALFAGSYTVAAMHGSMKSEEKEAVMERFLNNEVQVLVSTTVVEVGVNVPNATGMIVYDADRFGLSQLHQLRGRIQRGSEQGICWLLSDTKDSDARKRLNVLAKETSGFAIAMEDLRLRGPGDILGTRQSGLPGFSIGSLAEDTKILEQARLDAKEVVLDPENPDYVPLLEHVQSAYHVASLE